MLLTNEKSDSARTFNDNAGFIYLIRGLFFWFFHRLIF